MDGSIADVTVTEWENSYGPTVELFIYLDICQDTFIGGAEFRYCGEYILQIKNKKISSIAIHITFQSNKEEYNSFIFIEKTGKEKMHHFLIKKSDYNTSL